MPRQDKLVVLITCSSRAEARKIARVLVTKRLAACVNIIGAPVESIYRWQGKVEAAKELLLLVKTSRARFAALRNEVQQVHSYNVPEIIALPITGGSTEYLAWLETAVSARA